MKLSTLTFSALLISAIAAGQDKFTSFNQEKKSIDLSTGICMSYVDTGNTNGIPVLFLHGYTDTAKSFQLVIEDIKKINRDIRVIAPDLRGHGHTSMPDLSSCKNAPEKCFTPDLLAADIIDLMDQLCIEKFYVVGHSMGSVIAQTLAINYCDRVTSMVLVAALVNGKECSVIHDFLIEELIENDWKCMLEEELGADWPEDAYIVKPANMGEKVINYLRENWVVEPSAANDFLESIFPETLKIPLGTWIGAVKALGEIDYSAALRELNIPILILWGFEDNVAGSRALNRKDAEAQRK
jgi:pimeloyl-ACP methyl ester carboxylesterase